MKRIDTDGAVAAAIRNATPASIEALKRALKQRAEGREGERMSEAITLPGEIPGLLRRGSPIVWTLRAGGEKRGLFVRWSHDPSPYAIATDDDGCTCALTVDRVALDLTDATGRAHAAWWYAATFRGWPGGCRMVPERYPGGHWGPYSGVAGKWRVSHRGMATGSVCAKNVPALAVLDPNNPRLLEDGSRWVDAEALRLVVLHVWAQTKEAANATA